MTEVWSELSRIVNKFVLISFPDSDFSEKISSTSLHNIREDYHHNASCQDFGLIPTKMEISESCYCKASAYLLINRKVAWLLKKHNIWSYVI